MNIDFGEVLRRTWNIGWNHKLLWLYQMLPGALALLMMPLFFISNPGFTPFLPEPFRQGFPPELLIVLSVVLTIIMFTLAMFLGTLAQGATTYGALEADIGAEKPGFRETLKQSLPYFWRLFGLYAIFGTAWALMVFGLIGLNIGVSFITLGLGSLCMMPLYVLFFVAALLGYSVLELAQAAIVVDDLTIQEAVSKAWQMFRANILGIVLLMVLLYFAISIFSSLLMFPMMFPMMLLPIAFENSADLRTPVMLIFFVFFPIMMIVMTVVQGILMAFFQSAWLVAYRQLDRGQNTPVFANANA